MKTERGEFIIRRAEIGHRVAWSADVLRDGEKLLNTPFRDREYVDWPNGGSFHASKDGHYLSVWVS